MYEFSFDFEGLEPIDTAMVDRAVALWIQVTKELGIDFVSKKTKKGILMVPKDKEKALAKEFGTSETRAEFWMTKAKARFEEEWRKLKV